MLRLYLDWSFQRRAAKLRGDSHQLQNHTSLPDKTDVDVDAQREEQRFGGFSLFGSSHRGSHSDG